MPQFFLLNGEVWFLFHFMSKLIRLFIVSSLCAAGLQAFALVKDCDGGENSESALGSKIVIDFNSNQLTLQLTDKGFEDAVGSYPYVGLKKMQDGREYLHYQGGDPDEQNGYRYLLEPKLNAPAAVGTLLLRLDSGIEGYLDAIYFCHDPK
jgi:hypothetical protein